MSATTRVRTDACGKKGADAQKDETIRSNYCLTGSTASTDAESSATDTESVHPSIRENRVCRAFGGLSFVVDAGRVMRVARQGTLEFKSWGGARQGAGRKREGERARVAHAKRPALKPSHPMHITLRIEAGLGPPRCAA